MFTVQKQVNNATKPIQRQQKRKRKKGNAIAYCVQWLLPSLVSVWFGLFCSFISALPACDVRPNFDKLSK